MLERYWSDGDIGLDQRGTRFWGQILMVRIISGAARGMRLKTNDSLLTRPTQDRVKEAMFSTLIPYINGATVLDLFAGNGALGIEALSRGAGEAWFADASKICIDIINYNLKKAKLFENAHIIHSSWELCLEKVKNNSIPGLKFGIIFLDPPYKKGFIGESLRYVYKLGLYNKETVVVAEHDSTEDIEDQAGCFAKFKVKKYGTTTVSYFYVKEEY